MGHVQELEGRFNTSNDTCLITVPAGGIPAGDLLILGLGTNAAALPSINVTDDAGNTWSNDGDMQTAASVSVAQFRAVVGNDLAENDEITVKFAAALSKCAVSVQQFDDGIIAVDNGANGNSSGSSSNTPTTGPLDTTHADSLIVATFALNSASRTFTPGPGFTGGTKVVTTNGAGDRGVVMEWMYASALDTYVANGTLNSSSLYAAVARAYALGDPGAPGGTGKFKVHPGTVGADFASHPAKTHNGTSWITHPANRWNGTAWVPIT